MRGLVENGYKNKQQIFSDPKTNILKFAIRVFKANIVQFAVSVYFPS